MDAAQQSRYFFSEYTDRKRLRHIIVCSQLKAFQHIALEKLWDADENFVDEHALTVAISRIRGKIEVDAPPVCFWMRASNAETFLRNTLIGNGFVT